MTRYELELKRAELLDVANRLAQRISRARAAGDQELVEDLIYASTQLGQLSSCPLLHVVIDEVLEDDEPLAKRAS